MINEVVRALTELNLDVLLITAVQASSIVTDFRSTFRDWTAETTNATREVAEMALAHVIPSKVEAAYRRGDLLEKRRALMAAWSGFCDMVVPSMVMTVTADQPSLQPG